MNWFTNLMSNQFFVVGLSSWAFAQVLKTIIHAAVYKRWSGSGCLATAECRADILLLLPLWQP